MDFSQKTIEELEADLRTLQVILLKPGLSHEEIRLHQEHVAQLDAEITRRRRASAPPPTTQWTQPRPQSIPFYKTTRGIVLLGAAAVVLILLVVNKRAKHFATGLSETLVNPVSDSLSQARDDSMRVARQKEDFEELLRRVDLYDANSYGGSAQDAIAGAEELNSMAVDLSSRVNDESPIVRKQAATARKKLVGIQVKSFPILRRAWVKHADNTMWESDIDVVGSGTTVTFIGGVFAANKNVAEFYGTVSGALERLRFKRANFKWYSGDDEYQYYTIKSKADSAM